jgi:hypothetical protein
VVGEPDRGVLAAGVGVVDQLPELGGTGSGNEASRQERYERWNPYYISNST